MAFWVPKLFGTFKKRVPDPTYFVMTLPYVGRSLRVRQQKKPKILQKPTSSSGSSTSAFKMAAREASGKFHITIDRKVSQLQTCHHFEQIKISTIFGGT